MWTTWASPEGGGPGKEGCGRAKGAGLALWGRGSGSHFSAVFSDGYRKGPSPALPILLLFIFPTEDRQRLRYGPAQRQTTVIPMPHLPTLQPQRGIRSHMFKITTRLHPQTRLGLSRSECMGRKKSRFLFELKVFNIQATLLCMSFLETKGSWKITK